MNTADRPCFSLILATLGRRDELTVLLDSLVAQTNRDFELIVVDQNEAGYLDVLLARYSGHLTIHRVFSETGLSRARNVGLANACGDIIAFPDDDCFYPPATLEMARQALETSDSHSLVGCQKPFNTVTADCGDLKLEPLGRYSLFYKAMSIGLFIRREVFAGIGGFDETLGLGAGTPWGSGEESDLLIRAHQAGYLLCRCQQLVIWHADVNYQLPGLAGKARSYGRGRRRLLTKHAYPWWFVWLNGLWPLGCIVLRPFPQARVKYYWAMFLGRVID